MTIVDCMRGSNWNSTLINEDSSLVGTATLKWRCENSETGEEEVVETYLKEEKVFPEEDFEYEGEINGKQVEGRFSTGLGAMKTVHAVGDEKLTDAERAAGIAHINWYC